MRKPQLFLLHFAGGNCYSFDYIKPLLNNFEVECLELPGRGKRLGETLLRNFDLAVQDVYAQLIKKITNPVFLIYGHSMGAYLALKAGYMLQQQGRKPACLIVSGNIGPNEVQDKKCRYRMQHEEFIKELELLGGVPQDILNNTEYFGYFEPILRADFEVAEEHGLTGNIRVNAPIYAMMGSEEERVEEITNWGRFTNSWFKHEVLSGGHFFIHNHPERIAAAINFCYKNIAPIQHF